MRNVVPQLGAGERILEAADRPQFVGQRIAHRRPFMEETQVELRAGPADRIKLEGAGTLDPIAIGVRKIAHALAVVGQGNAVDDVFDLVIPGPQPRLAPRAEIVADFNFALPALRRDEVGIATVLPIAAEVRLVEEIVEADLTNATAKLETRVPIFGWPPAKGNAALRPEELAGRQVAVDSFEFRDFPAQRDLQIKIGCERSAQRSDRFVADFLNLAASTRKLDLLELAVVREAKQPPYLIERVERPLDRQLPVILAALPAIFCAADHFLDPRITIEPRSGAGIAVIELQDLRGDERLVLEMIESDRLQLARTERELIVAVPIEEITVELGDG